MFCTIGPEELRHPRLTRSGWIGLDGRPDRRGEPPTPGCHPRGADQSQMIWRLGNAFQEEWGKYFPE
jgi:hypothetical protein